MKAQATVSQQLEERGRACWKKSGQVVKVGLSHVVQLLVAGRGPIRKLANKQILTPNNPSHRHMHIWHQNKGKFSADVFSTFEHLALRWSTI